MWTGLYYLKGSSGNLWQFLVFSSAGQETGTVASGCDLLTLVRLLCFSDLNYHNACKLQLNIFYQTPFKNHQLHVSFDIFVLQKLFTSEIMHNLRLSSVPSGGQMIEIQKYLALGRYGYFISKAQHLNCPKLFIILLNH